jgi:hypothetical protein
MSANGSCLCGAISYKVDGPLRPVTACHCNQCRKQTGSFYTATSAADADFTIEGADNLTWFTASPEAKRGFCKTCGSALFWKWNGGDTISIMAGTLDGDTGLKLVEHIFVADKGDYYDLTDDLPKYPQDRNS